MSSWDELKDRIELYCEVREEPVTYNECLKCNKKKIPHPCWCATSLQQQFEDAIKEKLWGPAPSLIDMLRMTLGRWLNW